MPASGLKNKPHFAPQAIMINEQQLKRYYHRQLRKKGILLNIESMRHEAKWFHIFTHISLATSILALMLQPILGVSPSPLFYVLFILNFTFNFILAFAAANKTKAYHEKFKQEIVRAIVHLIAPNWSYQPKGYISKTEYANSGLFRKQYNYYGGDDLITGVIDQTSFRCSELHTEYETHSTDSNGNSRSTRHTIFRGLFFHADFHKHFVGQTYLSPNLTGGFFKKIKTLIYKNTDKGTLIKLENPEFEKIFMVHSSNPTEARYILTPVMMEAIVKISKQYKRKIHISFAGTKVYCAIRFDQELFEATLWHSAVKYQQIKFMYDLFMLNKVIVEELNLNTRIWTKE